MEFFDEMVKKVILLFYESQTVIKSFHSPDGYHVDRSVIPSTKLKHGLTFAEASKDIVDEVPTSSKSDTVEEFRAAEA